MDGIQEHYAVGVGKSHLKKLHTVWCHLNNFLKCQNYSDEEQISGFQWLGMVVEDGGGGRDMMWQWIVQRFLCDDGIVLSVDCGDGYMNLHMRQNCAGTHTHVKTGEIWIRSAV